MRILLCGDTHGNLPFLAACVKTAYERFNIEAAIQVGDLFWERIGHQALAERVHYIKNNRVPIYCIDGNHDNYALLKTFTGRHNKMAKANMQFCPRGTILEIGGARIGFLGGALAPDQPQYWNEAEQWYDNIPEPKLIDDFATAINNKPVDLLITHSCPSSIGIGIKGHPLLQDSIDDHITRAGFQASPIWDCGDYFLTDLYNKLVHKPIEWAFGHFHVVHRRKIGNTNFTCVGEMSDHSKPMTPVIYDTELKTVLL